MDLDKTLLEKYFTDKLPERIPSNECFELLLVLTEERPGALIMSPDFKDRKLLRKFCEDLNLEYFEVEEKHRSLLDRALRRDTRMFKGGFFVARNQERFNILKKSKGRFYGFSDKAVGKFLGYPEDDADYFAERAAEGKVWDETEEKIDELIEKGDLQRNELKYLEFTSYVPRPEKSNIIKAVEKGKQRENTLLELDNQLGIEIGENYLAEQVGQTVYSSECSSASKP